MWLWDICDTNYTHKNGTSIFGFMSEISRYDGAIIGFRKLDFDGYYILNFLFEQGFEFERELSGAPYRFTSLITDTGQHYYYKIVFGNGSIVTIFDTFKHFHQSIANTAKNYKLPILKGEIDYDMYREEGHIPTDEELDYIHKDTEIDMRALSIDINMGLYNITQTGNCKRILKKSVKDIEIIFPELNDMEDEFCRKAYRGGYAYLNPMYRDKDLKHLISLDINSMYPAQMLHQKIPTGEPLFGDGMYSTEKVPQGYDIYIQHLFASFRLKPNHVPTISKRTFKISSSDLYLSDSGENTCELYLSSPDLELFFENYYVFNVEYIDFAAFQWVQGKEISARDIKKLSKVDAIKKDGVGSIFYDYLVPFRITKETTEGAERDNAKRMQNIVYGALATSSEGGLYEPFINDKGLIAYKRYVGDKRKRMYIPAAVFITAWSRYFLIKNIQKVFNRFVYCDTDSLYLLGDTPPEGIPLHDTLYGYFKQEHTILKARFIGPKRYIYFGKDNKSPRINKYVVCCGATEEVKKQINFSNFHVGAEYGGKLQNKTVKGGKHLEETVYKIKE